MHKKVNTKITKLIEYYKLINHEIFYNDKAINRYSINNDQSNDVQKKLKELEDRLLSIKDCALKRNSKNLVLSDGNSKSKIMIIGEGPGANEDLMGLPFVGKAGKLLDKMLNAINLSRFNVYITNVVNYRPPENRKPTEEEIERYLPFLIRHIDIIKPKIIIILGSTALNAIIGDKDTISKARGKWYRKKIGNLMVNIIASFHPAFLMRQPDQKKMAWIDLKMVREKIKQLKIKIDK